MTREQQQKVARRGARAAMAIGAALVLFLTADYAVARFRAPRDDARILSIQKLVQEDAKFAPILATEHDAITAARRARKARTNVLSLLLIGAVAAFVGCSKWLITMEGRERLGAKALVQVQPAEIAGAPPTSAPGSPTRHEIDLSFVDRIVQQEGRSQEAAIPILQAIQAHYHYLPDEALVRVCELSEITPAQIAGTSSFYSGFRRSPVGRHVIRVCHGTACHVSGARQITDELRRKLRIPEGSDTDPQRMFTVDEVACLGCCSLAPVMMVDEHTAGKLTPSSADAAALAVVREKAQ